MRGTFDQSDSFSMLEPIAVQSQEHFGIFIRACAINCDIIVAIVRKGIRDHTDGQLHHSFRSTIEGFTHQEYTLTPTHHPSPHTPQHSTHVHTHTPTRYITHTPAHTHKGS